MRGQASTEYLILIAAAVAVVSIVALSILTAGGGQSTNVAFGACQQAAAMCKATKKTVPNDPCASCDKACIDPTSKKDIMNPATSLALSLCRAGYATQIYPGGAFPAVAVLSSVPANGSSAYPAPSTIEVTFNHAMDTASTNAAFRVTATYVGAPPLDGSISWAGGNTQLIFSGFTLTLGNQYIINVTTAAKDTYGTALASEYDSYFVYQDLTPPAVVSVMPTDLGIGDTSGSINVTFSKYMAQDATYYAFSLKDVTTSQYVTTGHLWFASADAAPDTKKTLRLATDVELAVGGGGGGLKTKLVVIPESALTIGDNYEVKVTTQARDVGGINMLSDFVSHFTAQDLLPPTVVSVSPGSGTPDYYYVKPNITFSEPMNTTLTSAAITLTDLTALPPMNVAGTVTWDAASTIFTFNPSSPLTMGHNINIQVATTAKDQHGNALQNALSSTFSVLNSPTVVSVTPANNAIYAGNTIQITFTLSMEPTTTQNAFNTYDNATGKPIVGTFSWSGGNTVLTFTVNSSNSLRYWHTYNITILGTAQSASGVAMGRNFESSFIASNIVGFAVGIGTAWTDGEILKTTDLGETWQTITSSVPHILRDVCMINATHGWAIGDSNTFWETHDGATWAAGTTVGGTDTRLMTSCRLDGVHQYLAGSNQVLTEVGIDYGVTGKAMEVDWRTRPELPSIISDAALTTTVNGMHGCLIGTPPAADYGIYCTPALGGLGVLASTWVKNYDNGAYMLTNIFFINETLGWASGASSSPAGVGVFKTTNGGSTWSTAWTLGWGGQAWPSYYIYFLNSTLGWMLVSNTGGATQAIYKTTNGGTGWSNIGTISSNAINGLFFINATVGFAPSNDNGAIYKTTDGGVNWVSKSTGSIYTIYSVYFAPV